MKKSAYIILTALFVGAFGNLADAQLSPSELAKLPVIYLEPGKKTEVVPGVMVTITPAEDVDESFMDSLKQAMGYTFDATLDTAYAADTTNGKLIFGYVNTDQSARLRGTWGKTIAKDSSTTMISIPVGIGQIEFDLPLASNTFYYAGGNGYADSVGVIYTNEKTFSTPPVPGSTISLNDFSCSSDTNTGDSTGMTELRIISNDAATIGYVLVSAGSTVDTSTAWNSGAIVYGSGDTVITISIDFTNLPQSSTYAAQAVVQNSSQAKTYSAVKICNIVLINDVDDVEGLLVEKVTFFPNPATESITVRISGFSPESMYTLRIYDLAGRVVLEQTLAQESTVIERGDLHPGMYIGSVLNNNRPDESKTRKLVFR